MSAKRSLNAAIRSEDVAIWSLDAVIRIQDSAIRSLDVALWSLDAAIRSEN